MLSNTSIYNDQHKSRPVCSYVSVPYTGKSQRAQQSRPLGNIDQKCINSVEPVLPSYSQLLKKQRQLAYGTLAHSLSLCGRGRWAKSVNIRTHISGKQTQSGTFKCWNTNCVSCCRKQSKKMADKIEMVMNHADLIGSEAYFITFTKSKDYSVEKSLNLTKAGLKSLRDWIKLQKYRKGIEVAYHYVIEDTISQPILSNQDQWYCKIHNHGHFLLIFKTELSKVEREEYIKRMSNCWMKSIKKNGGYTSKDHSVDVKHLSMSPDVIENVAGYMSKLISANTNTASNAQIKYEMTHSHNKFGKGRSMFQLLQDIVMFDRDCDIKIYRDILNAYFGKRKSHSNKTFHNYFKESKAVKKANELMWSSLYLDALLSKDTDYEKRVHEQFIKEVKGMSLEEYNKIEKETLEVDIPGCIYDRFVERDAYLSLLDFLKLAVKGHHKGLLTRFLTFNKMNPHYQTNRPRSCPKLRELDHIIDNIKDICPV